MLSCFSLASFDIDTSGGHRRQTKGWQNVLSAFPEIGDDLLYRKVAVCYTLSAVTQEVGLFIPGTQMKKLSLSEIK